MFVCVQDDDNESCTLLHLDHCVRSVLADLLITLVDFLSGATFFYIIYQHLAVFEETSTLSHCYAAWHWKQQFCLSVVDCYLSGNKELNSALVNPKLMHHCLQHLLIIRFWSRLFTKGITIDFKLPFMSVAMLLHHQAHIVLSVAVLLNHFIQELNLRQASPVKTPGQSHCGHWCFTCIEVPTRASKDVLDHTGICSWHDWSLWEVVICSTKLKLEMILTIRFWFTNTTS